MTEKKYIVALDQGTTSSRAVVMDHDANIISVSQREFEQIYPKPGWLAWWHTDRVEKRKERHLCL